MLSTDGYPYFYQGGNESIVFGFGLCHLVQTILQSTHPIYLVHPNPSHLSSGLKTLPVIKVPYHGISLRPRLVQNTLSKLGRTFLLVVCTYSSFLF